MTTDPSHNGDTLDIALSSAIVAAADHSARVLSVPTPNRRFDQIEAERTSPEWKSASQRIEPGIAGPPETVAHRLGRLILTSFALTFIVARLCVFLMMSRSVPHVFLRWGDTHVHHLCYGIMLLSIIAGYALIVRPHGHTRSVVAMLYGVALALTFDEFGLWINLGGSYWQRASVVAVFAVGACLAVISYLPLLRRLRRGHWAIACLILVGLFCTGVVISRAVHDDTIQLGELLRHVERTGPL